MSYISEIILLKREGCVKIKNIVPIRSKWGGLIENIDKTLLSPLTVLPEMIIFDRKIKKVAKTKTFSCIISFFNLDILLNRRNYANFPFL